MVDVGVDLGTANTVVCHPRDGVIFDEPSVMLLRRGARREVLVGHEAASLEGRTSPRARSRRPLRGGVITDLEAARTYVRAVAERVAGRQWRWRRLGAVMGVPLGATPLERRALTEAAEEAGMSHVTLLPEPIAGALGCGLDPMERRVHLVVDVGGGTAEIAAFCWGEVLVARSTRQAGDEMTTAVRWHLREAHDLVVDERGAEDIKIRASVDGGEVVAGGSDARTGRPRLVPVSAEEIDEALRPVVRGVVTALTSCLEELPPQATQDVLAGGVLLLGGGSLVPGLRGDLEKALGFPVKHVDRPLTCVAEGLAAAVAAPAVRRSYGS
ncbi:rod shape-determining protein [Actinomycetospora endophytica]|uniref:Cell shape-determining protein MreB n=1 Tax=Actinomycetospora endophytica TaxID=2291215 RepID=A0ABS8PCR3_9PSEU|nr:rod shape-determining protein [Actinomycetospora endophytica]MCD2195206.1 rod shape-determining protein [Actinomycetospora endophytica]